VSRVHPAAQEGYGRAAGTYARARPGYPAAAVDWLLGGTGAAAEVVEIGAGTGVFTRELVARGLRVTAVEPVAAMRERLAGLGAETVDAVAESLPFEAGSVACAIASQSLHWADVDRAFAELDRVLATGGAIGLVWNFRDLDVPWQRDLDVLLSRLRGDAPHSRDGRWQAAAQRSAFRIVDQASWRFEVQTDLAGVLDRVRSVSYVGALDEDDQADVDADVRAIVARHALDPSAVAFPYVTKAYVLRRP
jgi:SAM-dependent methyltransferase